MHYIHWNRANPMFRLDNTDHIVDVNNGNLPWEYDQVNIICPVSKPGVRYPEKHVIYSVSREEFDSCLRIYIYTGNPGVEGRLFQRFSSPFQHFSLVYIQKIQPLIDRNLVV